MLKNRVLFVCERSGGHIFPALCFARQFSQEELYFFVPVNRFRRFFNKNSWKVVGIVLNFRFLPLEAIIRFFEAFYLLITLRPQKVIGFGGRDSFFLVALASVLRIDAYIYEPNASFGRANKVLSLIVKNVYRGFYDILGKKETPIGVSLREDLDKVTKVESLKALNLRDDLPVVLCIGGSQGATFLNELCKRLVKEIDVNFQLIHISGQKDYAHLKEVYKEAKKDVKLFDFSEKINILYRASSLVISRAGASSLAEIAHCGIPAVLIPYPTAGKHQLKNAQCFEKEKAGIVFQEDNFSFDQFKIKFVELLENDGLRNQMKENLSLLSNKIAFKNVYSLIYS